MIPALTFTVCALQGTPSGPVDLTSEFQVDPGLEVTLWAETPQLYNPTAIDVDARGRVWVAEAVNYRQWDGRNPGLHRDEGDRIVILEDTDGDGRCDSSKVFVQEKELVAPLGICVLGNQVIVSCSPSAIVYTDENGDDVPDRREVLLTGFGGHDHDHGLHSFVAGPDGRWYFNVGNAGPHIVKDRLGWTLRSGSIYRGGGEHEADNVPGLVSDDGQVWTGGLVLRIGPKGEGLAVLAHNFRNNYEVALDSFGNLFQTDNDDDGNASCRTLWCMPGGNHGYFSADGARYWNADRKPGQATASAHWHQEDPGVVPAGCINGAGGPTGLCVYEGQGLPEKWRGVVLDCDAGANVVYGHVPHTVGAGIELTKSVFLSSRVGDATTRASTWFRPSDVCASTDGSVFVSDWWDPGVGGHAAGDRLAYGRILCVRTKGTPRVRPSYDLRTIPGAIQALCSPAVNVRWLGWRKLVEERKLAVPALEQLLAGPDARLRARALWVLAMIPDAATKALDNALLGSDNDLRITAWRATNMKPPFLTQLAKQLVEKNPPANMLGEIALSMRGVSFDSCWPVWPLIAQRYDGHDPYLLEALGIAAGGKEVRTYDMYLGPARDPLKWTEAQAKLAWRLHPPKAIPALALRASSGALEPRARREAVDALAFCKQREAAEAMLALALTGPADVRELAAFWIELRNENDWSEYGLARELAPLGRENARMAWSSGILRSGSKACDVDLTGARALWLVVTPGERGNGCDWSDWLDATLSGPQGEQPLTALPWVSARAGWGAVHADLNAVGEPLRLEGQVHEHGIGTHAASEIAWRLPAGCTRLRALCALDDGGTKQGGQPDVEFQVWLETPPDRTHFRELTRTLCDPSAAEEQRARAAAELALDREGGLLLIRQAQAGKLAGALREAAGKAIYRNPDMAVRALAGQAFPRRDAGGQTLPSAKELAQLRGDATRGREIFFGEPARCSTCHVFQGRGGDIGPNLSEISAKYGREAVIDALLNPSAAIALGYDTWIVETKDGALASGFVLADGEKLVLKDTSGKRSVIERSEIAAREKQQLSAMPDNVALELGAQAIADLASFLLQPGAPRGKLGSALQLFDGLSLAGWTGYLDDPKAKPEDVWSVADGVLHCQGKPTGYLRTEKDWESFELTLEWRFPAGSKPGNSGVLLRMQAPDKVWPTSIEAQLEHRNAGDIWNIGEFPMDVDRARTQGRHTSKLLPSNEKPVGEWNRYKITLDRGDLTLEVNGEVQNRARWCQVVPGKICLQSEGAPIEFRNIVLTPIE